MKNDAKEKEENIKQTFLKGIKELDNKVKDMHDGWDFVELVNQFICAFDNEYQYNKTYIRSFKEPFRNFVNQYNARRKFFLEFCNMIYSVLKDDEYATIGFDEYAFLTGVTKDIEIKKMPFDLKNRIPEVMTRRENNKIFIECTIRKRKTDNVRNYCEEIQMKNDKNNNLTEDEIKKLSTQFFENVRDEKDH